MSPSRLIIIKNMVSKFQKDEKLEKLIVKSDYSLVRFGFSRLDKDTYSLSKDNIKKFYIMFKSYFIYAKKSYDTTEIQIEI